MRACAYVTACLLSTASASAVLAQEPSSAPPTPAAESTELPAVVVETKEAAPKAKSKSAKKKSASKGPVVAAPAPAPQDPTGPGNANVSDKAPYGPVKDYVPKNTETGIKTDTPLKEIPQSISVVGAEQIRDQGAQTLQDALRYTAGVVADGYGLDSRTDTAFIRGTEAAEYLDGLRRTFSYYIYNYRIDPYFMERVEVLRGPASVLYGQAPVGGIVNSVSKRPQTQQGGEITVEYGTFDFKQVKFDMTGPVTSDGKWSYRLTGLARDAETQVDYVDDDRLALQPAITYRPDSNTTITVLGHFQKDHTGSTQQFFPHIGTVFPNVSGNRISQDRFVGEPTDKYDTEVASGTLMVEHRFNSVFKMQHSSRYADISNVYNSTYPGFFAGNVFLNPNFPYTDPAQTQMHRVKTIQSADTQIFNQDTNLEARFATGLLEHRVLGGVDYADFRAKGRAGDALNINPFDVYNPQYGQPEFLIGVPCGTLAAVPVAAVPVCDRPNQEITQTGLYVQDQMRLGNWIAVLGARKDWIENWTTGSTTQKDDAITYRAGLMYEFASGFTPYVSYGESFVPVVGTTRLGDSFDPQEGRMYELGFKYQPTGANFMINGAVYDIAESNRLASDPVNPLFSVQTGAISIKGFELEGTGKVTENLKVIAGYSYTEARYDGDDANAGNLVESVPVHLASLWGIYEFDGPYLNGWSVGAGTRYIGASWDSANVLRTPAVTLFDAMIAYEEEHWRWSINAYNLEDKEYMTTCLNRGDCFVGTARTITTGLTYKY
jgi:iron complex outermembrane receptor protein